MPTIRQVTANDKFRERRFSVLVKPAEDDFESPYTLKLENVDRQTEDAPRLGHGVHARQRLHATSKTFPIPPISAAA